MTKDHPIEKCQVVIGLMVDDKVVGSVVMPGKCLMGEPRDNMVFLFQSYLLLMEEIVKQ